MNLVNWYGVTRQRCAGNTTEVEMHLARNLLPRILPEPLLSIALYHFSLSFQDETKNFYGVKRNGRRIPIFPSCQAASTGRASGRGGHEPQREERRERVLGMLTKQ